MPLLFHETSKMPPPPSYWRTRCPFLTSHITHSLSLDPVARKRPSGEKATEYTGCVWCSKVWRHFPESGSHRRTVESNEALQRGGRREASILYGVDEGLCGQNVLQSVAID